MGKSFTQQAIKDLALSEMENTQKLHLKLITFTESSAGGRYIAVNESGKSAPIPYAKWRVVAEGFVVSTPGVSTENPAVYFGTSLGDIGAHSNHFGTVTQDATAGKNFAGSDVWVKDPYNVLATPDALTNTGTHVWTDGGDELGVWQTKINILQVTRPNDHALTIHPFIVIEVKI